MFEFGKVKFEDKNRIEEIRARAEHKLMSHAFSTLFLWEETLKLSVCVAEDFFAVKDALVSEYDYFFPCGNEESIRSFIDELVADGKPVRFLYMRNEDKAFLDKYYPGMFTYTYDRGSCEYIYDREAHLIKKGGKYTKQRYEIKQLLKSHDVKVQPLTPDKRMVALEIIHDWKVSHQKNDRSQIELYDDLIVSKKLLEYYDELEVSGIIVYVDSEPVAVAAAAPITEDTYCLQLAKSKAPMTGLVPFLWTECFKTVPEAVKYINGDDDMGVSGIRIQKEKMVPDCMNEIWVAQRGENN